MSVEHASDRLIDGYARGDTDLAVDELWSLEAHLEACAVCRSRLAEAVSAGAPGVAALVDTVWSGLEPRLAAATAVPRGRRRAAWLSPWLSRGLSRWLTPAAAPWLAMAVATTVIALLLDTGAAGRSPTRVPLILLLAPVLPVAGVAASWARGLDPAYELTAAAPRAGLQLVLRRTTSVLAVVVPVLLAGGPLTGVTAGQWLLPCLALTSLTLALGGVIGVTPAAAVLAGVWAAVVVGPYAVTGTTGTIGVALRPDGMPVWGLLLAVGAGVVVARRDAYTVLAAHR